MRARIVAFSSLLLAIALAACVVDPDEPNVGEESAAAGATPNRDNRWYGVHKTSDINRVTYYIDPTMSPLHIFAVAASVTAYNQLTGLDFQPGPMLIPGVFSPDLSDPEPHLIYCDSTDTSATTNYDKLAAAILDPVNADPNDIALWFRFSLWMRPASGKRHQDYLIHLRDTKDMPLTQQAGSSVLGSMVPEHETGHALGLFHEQNRSDRDQWVTVYQCCVDPTRTGDLALGDADSETLLSPYDINSMMQYPSDFGCKAASGGGCICDAMTANDRWDNASTPATDNEPSCSRDDLSPRAESGFVIDEPTGFSTEDLNVLYQLYPPKLGISDDDDQFGHALVAADFNGDGYTDLAVGTPGEAVDGLKAGRVYVYRGTYTGLMPWRKLNEPGNNRLDNDKFGYSLAAADLDGDGKSELFVGAPRRAWDGGARTGAVYVYDGNVIGFQVHHRITAASAGFDAGGGGDWFGETLATGDFNGDGSPELVVGAPRAHTVYVTNREVTSSGPDWRNYSKFGNSRSVSDEFGAALATGDVNNDGRDDILIGAPGQGAGRAYFARGQATETFGAIVELHENNPSSNDRFGEAVEIGRFDPFTDNLAAVVVGAPGRFDAEGRIFVFNSGVPDTAIVRSLSDFGIPNMAGARFGKRLLAAQLDMVGGEELVVGMPNESELFLPDAGLIAIFQGRQHESESSKLIPAIMTGTPNAHGFAMPNDHFGFALAAGDFDHRPATIFFGDTDTVSLTFSLINDLAVSTPHRNDRAGTVWLFQGFPTEMPAYTNDDGGQFVSFLGQGNSEDPGNLSDYRR